VSFGKDDYFPAEGIGKNDKGIVSGVDLVKRIVEIFRAYKIKAEVLAGSVRNARQVRELALAGADIATMPFKVLEDMLQHEKTVEGTIRFSRDTAEEYKRIFD
jgi:transaldolase